ncbi:MAG: YqeG family HAD IIIA-type phosphatase [Clostridia bacterium]|nr:YqeG family HAD IIIA-type phosphatase [Clostridia bacterium]
MSLFMPDVLLNSVLDIDIDLLKKLNVSALLLDVDNTLAVYGTREPISGVLDWIANMRENGIRLHILSNARPERIGAFADKVGLPFYYLSLKPLPFRIRSAAKKMGVMPQNIALVGDQIFTDVLGGNLSGMKTILTEPIKLETSLGFRIKRYFERKIKSKMKGEI